MELEQPAHAVANMYYVGAINRVGKEMENSPFFGTSYFVNPKGQFLSKGSYDKEEVVIADLDLEMITETRKLWQFYRTEDLKLTKNLWIYCLKRYIKTK